MEKPFYYGTEEDEKDRHIGERVTIGGVMVNFNCQLDTTQIN